MMITKWRSNRSLRKENEELRQELRRISIVAERAEAYAKDLKQLLERMNTQNKGLLFVINELTGFDPDLEDECG